MKIQRLPVLLFIFFVITSCKSTLYQTKWQDKTVTADGNPKEWEIPLRFYDSKSKLSYTITNDLENLYICMRITEDASQVKVMKAGMQVWIDTTGSNKQLTGILFPQRPPETTDNATHSSSETGSNGGGKHNGGGSGGYGGGSGGGSRSPNMANMRGRFQKDYKEMMLTGFHAPIRGSVPLTNDFGVQVGVNWDASKYDSSYIMIYEAVIPFRTFYKNKLTSADSLRKFGITITVNALPHAASQGGSKGGGHGGGGGGGMGGGGMGGGGMRGGGGGGRGGRGGGGKAPEPANPLYESNTLKMRFQMTLHPHPEVKL